MSATGIGADPGAWGALRATLFGDLPIEHWPSEPNDAPPWTTFVAARDHLGNGDVDLAIRAWAAVANPIAGNEPRHVLQAWHFLRSQGIAVDASIAHEPLGVVAEVAVGYGHDVLAAYRDGAVRFLSHAGPISIVEPGGARVGGAPRLDGAVAAWLAAASRHVARLPLGTGPFPLPGPGASRFTVLTCAGPRVVEGPEQHLAEVPEAGDLLASGAAVLQSLPRSG